MVQGDPLLRRPGIAAWAFLFAVVGLSLGAGDLRQLVGHVLGPTVFEARVRSTLDSVLAVVPSPAVSSGAMNSGASSGVSKSNGISRGVTVPKRATVIH